MGITSHVLAMAAVAPFFHRTIRVAVPNDHPLDRSLDHCATLEVQCRNGSVREAE